MQHQQPLLYLVFNSLLRGTSKNNAGGLGQTGRGGGGGYLTKFNTGRLHPEVQPLTLVYTILAEKVLFYIPFIDKGYPFHISTCNDSCCHFHVVLNK